MANGTRRGLNPRKKGAQSTSAIGARKRREAMEEAAERRALSRRSRGEDPAEYPAESPDVRARRILAAHVISADPANLEAATDAVKAGDVADRLYQLVGTSAGDTAARMASAFATALKIRRACFRDLGLPDDPDERDDFRASKPTQVSTTPKETRKESSLDAFMEDT